MENTFRKFCSIQIAQADSLLATAGLAAYRTRRCKTVILTDIYIPAVDDTYDFMLDENVPAIQVMEEVSEMISKKVKEQKPAQITDFVLYCRDTDTMLDPGLSLYANGIHDGSRLIFV